MPVNTILSEKADKLSWIYDLYMMSQAASSQGGPEQILDRLMEHIATGFGADSGCLALLDTIHCERLTIAAGIGLPARVIGIEVALDEGVLGWVTRNGEAVLLNGDIAGDPRFGVRQQRNETPVPASAMCWPLRIESRVIGAISLNRSASQPPYTEADLEHGAFIVKLLTVVIENIRLHMEQQRRIEGLSKMNQEVLEMNARLEEAQNKLLQSEKMASIGQLAAGVAHEINNPIGYVYSNLGSLENYLTDVFRIVAAYEQAEQGLDEASRQRVRALKEELDLDYLREDVFALMGESREGITRVKKIVQDLKDFSHLGSEDEWQWADLHRGLETTLNIVNNEIKYKAQVVKEYGELPEVECLPSQLNQVFMNILVNAAHAIESQGTITLRTGAAGDEVWVEIADTGKGVAPEHINRIFDPFFTTKPVGKGTGLGLSLSYGIVKKHNGRLEVQSQVGVGTRFRIVLPVRSSVAELAS